MQQQWMQQKLWQLKCFNPLLSFTANLKSHSNVSRSQVPGLFGLVNSPFFQIDKKSRSLDATKGHGSVFPGWIWTDLK